MRFLSNKETKSRSEKYIHLLNMATNKTSSGFWKILRDEKTKQNPTANTQKQFIIFMS